jgi:hypothetical protein
MNVTGTTSPFLSSASSNPRQIVIDDSFKKLEIRPESMRAMTPEEIARSKKQDEASRIGNDPSAPAIAADNDPGNLWGEVIIGGETVAQIFKSGLVVSKQGYDLPVDDFMQSAGERASQFLKQYGGSLEPAIRSKAYYF